jgi:hypothetical protein
MNYHFLKTPSPRESSLITVRSNCIDVVDHLLQATEVFAVEIQNEAGQWQEFRFVAFLRQGPGAVKVPARPEDVGIPGFKTPCRALPEG